MLKVLRIFYGFFLNKRLTSVLFFILIILLPIMSSLSPLFYKAFVDAIPSLNYQRLVLILIGYVGVRILSTLIHALSFYVGDHLMIDADRDSRITVFKYLQDLDFAFHANKSSGSLSSAIKRGTGAMWNIHMSIHFRIVNVLVSFTVMFYFFQTLDYRIGSLSVVSLILVLIATKFFVERNVSTRKALNKSEDTVSAVIVDNMINFETVKLFAKENWEQRRLSQTLVGWKKNLWKFAMSFRRMDLGMGAVISLSVFFILLISLKLAVVGNMSVGDFVLVLGFIEVFYPRLWDLVWGLRDIAKSYSDVERYFNLLGYSIQVKDPANPVKVKSVSGEIEYENVGFTYEKNEKDAIKNVNLKIRQGQSVALVGKSGAGKTTIVKLLMRFFDTQRGKITIDGIDIKKFKKSDLRSFMGVVPQEPILFNNTIGYNISYGRNSVTKKEMAAASKLANIHDFIGNLPKGYETQVGERGIKLSGGQKQRVAIARMILSNPEIIIFDEATSQLDSESERLIQNAFWKASEDKTTIIIAHRLSTVMRADKIVVMEKGRITEEGSHHDLINRKNSLYKHFWDLQTAND